MQTCSLHTEIIKTHSRFKHCITLFSFSASLIGLTGLLFISKLTSLIIYPKYLFVLSLTMGFPLIFHNRWPPILKPIQPYYWLTFLGFFLPFQFSLLLLLNQNQICLHLATLMSFTILVLLIKTVFIAPISLSGILISYIIYYFLYDGKLENNNIIITIYSIFIITLFIGIIEFQRQKHQEKKFNHLNSISGTIAHELRTPIASILLGLEALRKYPINKNWFCRICEIL